jgi:hypothetical protein
MQTIKRLAILLAAPLFIGGCYARVRTEPLPPPVVAVDYEPVYYGSHVIYYDDGGAPFYVEAGARIYIPQSHPQYTTYTRHYHRNPRGYHEWSHRHRHREPVRRVPPRRYHRR